MTNVDAQPTIRAVEDDDLLDAAARVLERDGMAGLSITAIAQEAGCSRVTLHRRGNRLGDYVIGVLGRTSADLRASLWPVLTASGSAAERLEAAYTVLCEVCERHTGVMAAVYDLPPAPLPDRPDRTTSFQFIEPFERLLRDGVIDGSLRSDDPVADATMTANAVAWTYLHMRRAHGWAADDVTRRVVAMAMASARAVPT